MFNLLRFRLWDNFDRIQAAVQAMTAESQMVNITVFLVFHINSIWLKQSLGHFPSAQLDLHF